MVNQSVDVQIPTDRVGPHVIPSMVNRKINVQIFKENPTVQSAYARVIWTETRLTSPRMIFRLPSTISTPETPPAGCQPPSSSPRSARKSSPSGPILYPHQPPHIEHEDRSDIFSHLVDQTRPETRPDRNRPLRCRFRGSPILVNRIPLLLT